MATPVTGFKTGFSYDYRGVGSNQPGGPNYINVFAWYASLQATEKLSFHGRGEFLWMSHSLGGPTLPSKVLAFTGTMQYDLWKNVLSRLEIRWDHSANGTEAYGGDPGGAGTPTKKNSVLVAANIVYKF